VGPARQPSAIAAAADAEARRAAHFEARLREMEGFARGEGDVPMIVKRSGRVSQGHIDDARQMMAYYLGLAHQRAAGVPKSDAAAAAWFAHAAQRAHSPSQVLLARALIRGEGVTVDPLQAHRWLSIAAQAGNSAARKELDELERGMEPALLDKARALGPMQPGS
jgi:TPR repeat protein